MVCILLFLQLSNIEAFTKDTSLFVNGTLVEIKFPQKEIVGTILVLPGWNFPQNDICLKSNFCELASNGGYVLVLPNMLKSIYPTQYFPESRKDWLQYPTLTWLKDTLIPLVSEKFQILKKGDNNFALGISTGGRGVAMLSIYTDSIFKAGACLSGDFNQSAMPSDNLMRGVYSDFKLFPDRWNGTDNPFQQANKVKIPLYIAHGEEDKIVPCDQSKQFFNQLNKVSKIKNHRLSINPTAGHNYEFWQSEYISVLAYFKSYSKSLLKK